MIIANEPLQVEWTDAMELKVFGSVLTPDTRTVKQMLDAVKDLEDVQKLPAENGTYYMYRDVKREEDAALFQNAGIRYDITVLESNPLGSEYNKTYGHYHEMHDEQLSFPELYEVLSGEAHYVLQERLPGDKVGRVFIVKALAGDKLIVPPNFGHVTINPRNEPLVMDNLVEAHFKSEYGPYKTNRGAVYYETRNGIEKNRNYSDVTHVIEIDAKTFNRKVHADLAEVLEKKKNYAQFIEQPELFRFLREPREIEF
ncbi:glucose-6-phosphate isomerase [Candidatus Micrarchaeota archaeon]|nr:glucose-6-phosphate isomerase [Candidatus Micrarchaeota archaeon]